MTISRDNIIFTSGAVVGMKLAGLNKATVLDAYQHPTKQGDLRRKRQQKIKILEDKQIGLVYRENDFGDVVVEQVWVQPVEDK